MRIFALVLMLLLVFGCSAPDVPDQVVDDLPPLVQESEEILFGVLPLRNPTDMLERFGPIETYLRETTGLNIRMKYYPTEGAVGGYSAVVRDLVNGDIQFAYLAPVTISQAYVISGGGVIPFICAQNKGSPTYTGDIAVRVDSGYQTIEDLKGKKVCGTSASSTSGNLMPTAHLLSLGINKTEYFDFEFLGAHDKAAEAVLAGQMEAAFINDATMSKYNKDSVQLRSVYMHPPVPEFPFCVNTEAVSDADFQKIKAAFLSQHESEEGMAAIIASNPAYEKWVEIAWDDYISIKEAIDQIYGDIFYDLDAWQG